MLDKRDVWRYAHPAGLKAVVTRIRRESYRVVVVKATGEKTDQFPFREDEVLPWLEGKYGPGWAPQVDDPPPDSQAEIEAYDSQGQRLAIGDVVSFTLRSVIQRGYITKMGKGAEAYPYLIIDRRCQVASILVTKVK